MPARTKGAKSVQSVRDQNKTHGNWTCLFPTGEISSGQVDKVLIYDGDDGERKIYRRVLGNQDGCWTVKTADVIKSLNIRTLFLT